MMTFLHPGDLDSVSFLIFCLFGIGIVLAITFGLAYLGGALAESNAKKWEKRLNADKPENLDD